MRPPDPNYSAQSLLEMLLDQANQEVSGEMNREPAAAQYMAVGRPNVIPERTLLQKSFPGGDMSINAAPGVPVMLGGATVTPGPAQINLDSPWAKMLQKLPPEQAQELIRKLQEEAWMNQRRR